MAAAARKASSNRHIDQKHPKGEAYNVCITKQSLNLPMPMIKINASHFDSYTIST